MKSGTSVPTVVFLALTITTSAAIGVISTIGISTQETSAWGSVILPVNTSLKVSSSYDCLASRYSLNFSLADQSTLTGGFSAEEPGVTVYVATVQQAASTFQGHPTDWVYSTGPVNSAHFAVVLTPGSYVVWIEGADRNCGPSIIPLEKLTQVNITEGFTLYPSHDLTSSISTSVGKTFIIQLGSNAGSTGYDWIISTSAGIQYLNYTVVSPATIAGGSDVRDYFFRAVQTGTQTITLRDERPWPPYAVAATINLQVTVS
jgi:predicted secreted protein